MIKVYAVPNKKRKRKATLCIDFPTDPNQNTVKLLETLLNSKVYQIIRKDDKITYVFLCQESCVTDIKIDLAKIALHRTACQRFDEAFPSIDDANDCYGINKK